MPKASRARCIAWNTGWGNSHEISLNYGPVRTDDMYPVSTKKSPQAILSSRPKANLKPNLKEYLVVSDESARFIVVYSVQQIKYEILAYVYELGGDFCDYFVGIAENPEATLFENHKLDKSKDPWLYRQALSNTAARTIRDYFSNRLRVDGTLVINGNEDTDWVYVYKKSETTSP